MERIKFVDQDPRIFKILTLYLLLKRHDEHTILRCSTLDNREIDFEELNRAMVFTLLSLLCLISSVGDSDLFMPRLASMIIVVLVVSFTLVNNFWFSSGLRLDHRPYYLLRPSWSHKLNPKSRTLRASVLSLATLPCGESWE